MKALALVVFLLLTLSTFQQLLLRDLKKSSSAIPRPKEASAAGIPSDADLAKNYKCSGPRCPRIPFWPHWHWCKVWDCFYTECFKYDL